MLLAHTGSSSHASHVSTWQAIFALAAGLLFLLDYPWEGRLLEKGTQAFVLSKENDRSSNLPLCTVISLDHQLHVTVDSLHYQKTFRCSDEDL